MSVAEAREKILAQVRGNFDDFLADRQLGKPWLYFFGPTTTHRFWVKGSGSRCCGALDPDSLKGRLHTEFLPDVPEVRQDVAVGLSRRMRSRGCLHRRGVDRNALRKSASWTLDDHRHQQRPRNAGRAFRQMQSLRSRRERRAHHPAQAPGIKGGRIVDDVVRLPDLAPTFMEIQVE